MENHLAEIENRQKIRVTEVTEVTGFDDNGIFVTLTENAMAICGKDLRIEILDLKQGLLVAKGTIESVAYTKKRVKKSLKEWFKR